MRSTSGAVVILGLCFTIRADGFTILCSKSINAPSGSPLFLFYLHIKLQWIYWVCTWLFTQAVIYYPFSYCFLLIGCLHTLLYIRPFIKAFCQRLLVDGRVTYIYIYIYMYISVQPFSFNPPLWIHFYLCRETFRQQAKYQVENLATTITSVWFAMTNQTWSENTLNQCQL